MLWAILLVRQTYDLRAGRDKIVTFDRYNFNADGNLTIIAESDSDQMVAIAIYNSTVLAHLEQSEKSDENLCTAENLTYKLRYIMDIQGGSARLEIKFNDTEVIAVAASACNTSDVTDVHLTGYFSNSDSLLSADVYPCLYLKPISAIVYSVMMCIWIVFAVKRRPRFTLVWYLLTFTQVLLILDNLIFFGVLWISSKSHDETPLSWVRYITRCISVGMFYCTIIIAAIRVSLPTDKRLNRNHIVGGIATGIFLGVPLTAVEGFNKSDSQLWYNFLAAVWLFMYWGLSFSLMFSGMGPLAAKVDEIRKSGINHKETPIGEQWFALTYHLNLYAFMLFTGLVWVLIPCPEKSYFWTSQVVLDVPFVFEMLLSVILFLSLKQSYDVSSADLVLADPAPQKPPAEDPVEQRGHDTTFRDEEANLKTRLVNPESDAL